MSATSPKSVFLTYHRLVGPALARPVGDPLLYDLDVDRYVQHVETIARRARSSEDGRTVLGDGRELYVTFDDGTADHLLAARILEDHGLTGTFFVTTDFLDRPGYLGRAEVAAMAAAGHRIGSHSVSHPRLSQVDEGRQRFELDDSRADLRRLTGQPVDWLAFPGGFYSDLTIALAREAGYTLFRTMDWGYSPRCPAGLVTCWPVFAWTTAERISTVLDGRASSWQYRLKQAVKARLGVGAYTALRDALYGSVLARPAKGGGVE
jgi:peptidoglycan/xylan/chitin deacetylase (PgdA/CDA1 family)